MSDMDVIREIEKELGVSLVETNELEWDSKSYCINENGQITELGLYDCEIKDINRIDCLLTQLEYLQSLDLSSNQLSSIAGLDNLSNLQSLDLSSNQLGSIVGLDNLSNLQSLYLSYNQLSSIVGIEKLSNLQSLDLRYNPITVIPQWITNFKMNIKWSEGYEATGILFYDNPLKSPPPEIIKQGKKAVQDYFKSIEKGDLVMLNEVKLMLIGEGMVGKTSLLKQIQHLDFDKNESQTHGINIVSINSDRIGIPVENCWINCWDFGGQEIMHASHSFFMSNRSLYILVLDSRTDAKKYYWLKHIEKYGGDSPVIVVMNKIDENPSYNIEQKRINSYLKNIKNRFHRVSCKNGEGIEQLISSIARTIPETDLYGTYISKDWLEIKNRLINETRENSYINRDKFIKICKGRNVHDESMMQTILQFLNDIGVVLFFKEINLADIYVLDPHWVTIGVYKIICSGKIENGILDSHDLDFILNREEIKTAEYDPAKEKKISYNYNEQRYILDIMKQFELCYDYGNNSGIYIIPDKLPKELSDEPEFSEAPGTTYEKSQSASPLIFIMEYDYLPASVISRVMIRMKNDIVDRLMWRYGMILRNQDGCRAKIKADEPNKSITITVHGEHRRKREYFAVIRHQIMDVNRSFENLEVKEFIPLPGYPDHKVEYQELLGYEKSGRDEYFVGKLGKAFSVSKLLDTVIRREDRDKEREMGNQHIDFHPSITLSPEFKNIGNPVINVGQRQQSDQHADLKSAQLQKTDVSQTQEVSQEVIQEVKTVQSLFKNMKEDILDEIDISIEDEKERKRLTKELERAEKAFAELEQASSEGRKEIEEGSKHRLTDFFDSLADENSRINKAMKMVSNGADKVKKLARTYNNLAPFFALPSIPPVLLGSDDDKADK